MIVSLLVASLFAVTPAHATSAADSSISFAQSAEGRHARLIEGAGLAASFKPSQTPALRLTDSHRFSVASAPYLPLDAGGAVSSGTEPVLALVLGLLIGFGTGHLVAGDTSGFILFLVVDVAIIVASSVLSSIVVPWLWSLGGLALLASHIIQGIDAYQKAGGNRIVEETRKKAVLVADVTNGREAPRVTTRAFAISF
ncbi:MAG: hypothetical protein ABW123_01680 [Cystobacter sp.]